MAAKWLFDCSAIERPQSYPAITASGHQLLALRTKRHRSSFSPLASLPLLPHRSRPIEQYYSSGLTGYPHPLPIAVDGNVMDFPFSQCRKSNFSRFFDRLLKCF